jgi:hypothetical protein
MRQMRACASEVVDGLYAQVPILPSIGGPDDSSVSLIHPCHVRHKFIAYHHDASGGLVYRYT